MPTNGYSTPNATAPEMTAPSMPDLSPNSSGDMPPDSNEEVYRGSLNYNLRTNIGTYVVIEFLIGTSNLVVKEGILYSVGVNYITLYNNVENYYTLCDFYSIKFVTFYDPRYLRRRTRDEISAVRNYDTAPMSFYYTSVVPNDAPPPPGMKQTAMPSF